MQITHEQYFELFNIRAGLKDSLDRLDAEIEDLVHDRKRLTEKLALLDDMLEQMHKELHA